MAVLSRTRLCRQSAGSCCEGWDKAEGQEAKRVTLVDTDMTECSRRRGFCWANHSPTLYMALNLTAVCNKWYLQLQEILQKTNKQTTTTNQNSHGWESSSASIPNSRNFPNHGFGNALNQQVTLFCLIYFNGRQYGRVVRWGSSIVIIALSIISYCYQ